MARRRPRIDRLSMGGAEVARNNLHPLPRHKLARDRSGAAASDTVVREAAVARSAPRPAPAGAAVPGGRGARTASHPAREAAAALASAVLSELRATRNRRLPRPLDECTDHYCAVPMGNAAALR